MSVYQPVSTNFSNPPFIKVATFLNGMKVDKGVGRQLGIRNSSMFSRWLTSVSTVYLLYKEKEKRGVIVVRGERLVSKVDGGQGQSSPDFVGGAA